MPNNQIKSLTVDGVTYDIVDETSGYMKGMTILSYGNSTWQDFLTAYNEQKVVYCRASSQSNPASGEQTRLAFMAYVNDADTPTEVEFQYYRSVSTHTEAQQGDQVFVYKLTSAGNWTVTTREASVKVAVGGDLTGSYFNGVYTVSGDIPNIEVEPKVTTGVNIADITVDATTYELYAPTGGGGSVESVGVSNATNGGLSVSGSPITSSGTITIGHSNVLTSAQTTQAVYPIKIDKNGHISAYGSAVTIPVITLNGSSTTSPSFYAPISAGNNGNYLKSNGSGAPVWAGLPEAHDLYYNPESESAMYFEDVGSTLDYVVDTSEAAYGIASTIPSWAMASSKPSYNFSEIGNTPTTISGYGITDALTIGTTATTAAAGNHTHTTTLATDTGTSSITLASAGKYKLTAGGTSVIFTMPTIPTVSYPVTSVNTKTGDVTLSASDVGAAATSHTHGNITSGGDITATAPTIANGDQIIINDHSASKITNGPTFDGSTTTTALTPKGTWESFSKFSGSYNDLTNKPTIPSAASLLDIFYPVGTIYETTVAPETFNPNNVWGGEWTRIKDKFLLSAGDIYTGGDSGGSTTVTLSEANIPTHKHGAGGLTATSTDTDHVHTGPSHSHGPSQSGEYYLTVDTSIGNARFNISSSGNRYTVGYAAADHFSNRGTTGNAGTGNTGAMNQHKTHTHTVSGNTESVGSGTAFDNMPPYVVVYMWKRIA